ncbi:Nuclear RNA export factor 1 [Pseudolycoriella hygida]|uniref:Nuclear RNA export factor 1 n=1 Tax=Pseudolycoriella hygida TaxID=35572 RepID=A0A9Q0MNG2_9DIPT|nr:Nuclear RNA export factor 1 [Pseudolycoriella hygida]
MQKQNNVRFENRIWSRNAHCGNNGIRFVERESDTESFRKQVNRGTNIRRVSFKPSGTGGTGGYPFNNKQKNLNLAITATIGEDDDMVDFPVGLNRDGNYHRNSNARFRRRGSPIPRTGHGPPGMRKLINGSFGWFLVTIPHGQKYDKENVLRELQTLFTPDPFIPYYVKVESSAISFYVDDPKIAQALLYGDGTISFPDGCKMSIKVYSNIPQIELNTNMKEKMKLAMSKRYNPATKALDLSKFHRDVDLRDVFCGLFRPTIMLVVIDIVAENIPDLEALDLSDNNIRSLGHLRSLKMKLPCLKVLHMADNKIMSLHALEMIKECQLVDLVLKGNPLRHRLREETVYVRMENLHSKSTTNPIFYSEIRKKFPKLLRLDFVNLPPPMGFDIPDEISIPSPKASYLCNHNGADIVRQFLEQYFIIFDSNNRQPLLDAYHEHAMFSLTVTHNSQQGQRLGSYLPHNRNIVRIKDYDARNRHLKCGRLPVVSFLSELPATQHDPHSFAVDLSLFTSKLILLTVTGLYRDKSKPSENICSFQRILAIVPSGSGFCIKNEMLHINNPTMAQIKAAFKSNAPSNAAPVAAPPTTTAPPSMDDATKLQMIQLMSQRSNMNLEWSEKCLMETNWDFDRAAFVFTELNNQQKIPPEAFAK